MQNKVLLKINNFDCSVEHINEVIGVQPTKFWLAGDILPEAKSGAKRKTSSWQLIADIPESDLLSDHIDYMLNFIKIKSDKIYQLSQKYESEFTIVSYCRGDNDFNFGAYLDNQSIGIIKKAGLNLDIDVYFLP